MSRSLSKRLRCSTVNETGYDYLEMVVESWRVLIINYRSGK
jgi:hypothetical protein